MSTLSKGRFLNNEKRLLIALRSVVALVLVAFFVSRPAHFETPWQFWFTLVLFALTNVVLFFEELKVLRLPRSHFLIFAFDVAMISVLMIFLGERSGEFYIVFFMTIFVAAASKSMRYAFVVSLMMSALYWFLASRGAADILPFSSAFLVRVVFFFIVSMFVGYLSEEAEARRKTAEQLAKRARKAEEATRVVKTANVAKEERLRVLFEYAPDWHYLHDLEGVLLDGNRATEELTGYRKEELVGKSLLRLKLLSAEQMPKAAALLARNALGLPAGPDEFVLNRKDGTRVNVEIRTFPVKIAGESLVLGVARDITERKRAEEQLLIDHEDLRRLASELSQTEERERRRIASDLHDRVGTALAFTKLRLGMLKQSTSSDDVSEQVAEISGLLDKAIRDTRSLTFDIGSPTLYELGFDAAVQELAEEFQGDHNIAVRFETDSEAKSLDEPFRIVLFRAVRECLVNVIKHAHASEVSVSIRRDDGSIRVSVEDGGIGFDTSEIESRAGRRSGLGLFSIRERLGFLGGQFEIESRKGRGTKAILSAPLGGAQVPQEGK